MTIVRIILLLLCAVFAPGCTGPAKSYGITLRMLPDEERSVVEEILNVKEPAIISIYYGPEWRSLRIVARILDNDELVATEYSWPGGDWSFERPARLRVLYRTTRPRMIRMFYDFRCQISRVEKQPDDYPEVITSNPQWAAHVIPGEADLLLRHPWSTRNCYWLATAVVLMRDALSDPNERELHDVVPAEWLDEYRIRHRVATGIRLHEVGSYDAWLGLYLHIAISYFDLEQKFVHQLNIDAEQ